MPDFEIADSLFNRHTLNKNNFIDISKLVSPECRGGGKRYLLNAAEKPYGTWYGTVAPWSGLTKVNHQIDINHSKQKLETEASGSSFLRSAPR